jgi:stage II sporulation protein D
MMRRDGVRGTGGEWPRRARASLAIATSAKFVTLAALTGMLLLAGPAHPAAADEERSAQRVTGGIRFTAPDETLIELSGVPTARRFLDTVELLPRRDGVDVVNELAFDTYLYGLAEVPQSWPEAVLDAQVIAARSYAWRSVQRGTFRDYDICATVACQVFRGAEILLGPNGDRWRDAVDRTSGQVLVDGGEPILARYFSTSGGRTYANDEVFPSSGAFSYLQAIADPYDALSPLHRWEVRFDRDDFDAILAEGRTLSATVPFATIERLGPADDPRAEVRITGQNGRSVTLRAIVLRDFLSSRAGELFPDRYPPLRADGARPLPSTIPTTRYGFEVSADEVVLRGLGWGHGVGMGQWGAHARALAGHSANEILAAYYGGLEPVAAPALPERIRAGMGRARTDEDGTLTVRLTTPTTVSTLTGAGIGTSTPAPSLGTWRVGRIGADLAVLAPPGDGEPLELCASRTYPGVTWGPGATLGSVHPGDSDATDVRITVNKPVLLRLEVTTEAGQVVLSRELGLAEQGVHWVRWFHDGADGERIDAGRYRVALIGSDQDGTVAGKASRVLTIR